MMSAYESLQLSQQIYYDRYQFADVFVQIKRAPDNLSARIVEIPGVRRVQMDWAAKPRKQGEGDFIEQL